MSDDNSKSEEIENITVEFQPYKWELDDGETLNKRNTENPGDDNCFTTIYIHGLTEDKKSVAVKITDFKPWVYIELDNKIKWSNGKVEVLYSYINSRLGNNRPIRKKFVEKKKIYYMKTAKFLWLTFHTVHGIEDLKRMLQRPVVVHGIGKIKLTMHENQKNATAILKLQATKKLYPSGWLSVTGKSLEKFSTADIEIDCSYKDLKPIKKDAVTDPLIVSYDIECISSDPSGMTFPDPKRKNDLVIVISATVARYFDKVQKNYSLVNDEGGRKIEPIENCELLHFKNEKSLLLGWTKFINKINPDVIISYNGLSFDDHYIAERASVKLIFPSFSKMGRIIDRSAVMSERSWRSSAYGDQKFQYLDIPGILHLDMFPVISKEYTDLSGYRLDDVSDHFLNEHKLDLPAKDMIQMYHAGGVDNMRKIVEYCNQDTLLPFRLMKHLNTWISLIEMSNVMRIQMFDLITRGQQVRIFAQLFCYTYLNGFVFQTRWSDYHPKDEDKEFVGATVQNPKTGLWEFISTFDFKSLYPTSIIAYNICFSTYVPDNENPDPESYHTITVDSHVGCEHDKTIRKSAVTRRLCKTEIFRFYKAEVKKGIVPEILEFLLDARDKAKKEMKNILKKIDSVDCLDEKEKLMITYTIFNKRQNGLKIQANSVYGGFGSEFSEAPFYPAAASTTAVGRHKIEESIEFVKDEYDDTTLVYGDTDSAMFHFSGLKTAKEVFERSRKIEKDINKIFPPPMYLEFENISGKYLLLKKKNYIKEVIDEDGKVLEVDKKGVVSKRRDNCEFLREKYMDLVSLVMNRRQIWEIYRFLENTVDSLISGDVELEKLIITKSIKDSYKATNLPHLAVANKMRDRGKYVVSGTRIPYIFVKTERYQDPQYKKAEDPDYYLEHKDEVKIDYLYYFEKQIVNPFDEILFVRFKKEKILENLFKLLRKDAVKVHDYFNVQFIVSE